MRYVLLMLAVAAISVAATDARSGSGPALNQARLAASEGDRAKAARRRGRRGPRGPVGPRGPAGMQSVTYETGPTVEYCATGGGPCAIAGSTATCPEGTVVTGGGFVSTAVRTYVEYATARSRTYSVIVYNGSGLPGTITAQAICAAGPSVVSARPTSVNEDKRDVASKVDELQDRLKREGGDG